MPSGDTGHASLRAMLAGLGTAGMLLGAVAAVAALTVGVVAFSGWPGSPEADRRPAVTLGGEDGGAQARIAFAARSALGDSATSRVTASTQRDGTTANGADGPGAAGSPRQAPEPGPAPAGNTATTGAEAKSPARETPATREDDRRGVADVTDLTGRELGGAVKDSGAAIGGAARPVSSPTAEAVSTLGERIGDAVTAATEALSELLRGTPNRPPGA